MEKDRKLTPLFLKTYTQKFDLNTIFLLDLSKKGIGNVGSLPECTNLLMLDLSHNQLMVITGLESLVNLKHINVSYNKLTQIDALKGCSQLQKIEAQGNQIKDLRTLECISANTKDIQVIYLQEFNLLGQNPVCQSKNYRKKIFDLFSKLKGLDGYRQGFEVFDFSPIDFGDDKLPDYHSENTWYNEEVNTLNPTKSMFEKTPQLKKDEDAFKDVINQCQSLLDRKANILTF